MDHLLEGCVAFPNAVTDPNPFALVNTLKKGEGFLLLSTGNDRKRWLFNLVSSIKTHYPEAPIHVLTDTPLDLDHTLVEPRFREESRFYKTQLDRFSPFDVTLFLDDDTLILAPFGNFDDLLGSDDVAMAIDPFATMGRWKSHVAKNCRGVTIAWDRFLDLLPDACEGLPYHNSGVIAWRRSAKATQLFSTWHNLWLHGGGGADQTWLALAIIETKAEIRTLPASLNFYPVVEHYNGHPVVPSASDARIVHFLSPQGKRRMKDFIPLNAPPDPAFTQFMDQQRFATEEKAERECAEIHLVIARFNEDLTWLSEVPRNIRIVVYNKGDALPHAEWQKNGDLIEARPNAGRESETYLHYISSNLSLGCRKVIFCQGDPFPHSPDFLAILSKMDEWNSVQAMSCRWLEEQSIPPGYVLEGDTKDRIGGLRVRRECFSLRNLSPVAFFDPGAVNILKEYLEFHSLSEGTNIVEHFLRMVRWNELADLAAEADFGFFAYGALFSVDAELLRRISTDSVYRMLDLTNSHPVHGYVFERLWLHFFGHPFTKLEFPPSEATVLFGR